MDVNSDNNKLFQSSHMIMLKVYTVFVIAFIVVIILLKWEIWMIIPILAGLVVSWYIRIKSVLTDYQSIWVYSILMMVTFFFYGTHKESTFDLAIIISVVMILLTITGIKSIITFNQVVYYITLVYGLCLRVVEKDEFDALMISRIVLHVVLVTAVAELSKNIIEKWSMVIDGSREEVENLKEETGRLNDFLANVSHELRTPVNAIIGLTGICIDKEDRTDIKEDMVAVRSAGYKVAEQISDILDYSEIDRGNIVLNCEDYMIFSMMNDLMTELREYKHDNVELAIDVDPQIPAIMNTDVAKMKKIIKALVSNGLKYTKEGGVYTKLYVEKRPYGVNFCIEVKDTGVGMTEEVLSKIYDRFYQIDSGRARSSGGLGLGLGIVSGFVSLMGGFMTIKSTPGVGTTVHVSVPQKVIDESSCMSVKNPEKLCLGAFLHFDKFENPVVREYYNAVILNMVKGLGVQMHRVENINNLKKLMESVSLTHLFIGEEEYSANKDFIDSQADNTIVTVVADSDFVADKGSIIKVMEKPFYCFPVVNILNANPADRKNTGHKMKLINVHALVVDDEPMNLVVAKSIFSRYGMKVSTALSGQESIDMCREVTYDIIFMDHMMGGMDGVEAMKKIRSDVKGLNKNIPVVALTANAMSSAKQMFMDEGFDGFVSKPIEIEELERTMKKLLPKSQVTYVEKTEEAVEEKTEEKAEEKKQASEETKTQAPADNKNPSAFASVRQSLEAMGMDVDAGLGYSADDEEFYKMLLQQYSAEKKEKTKGLKKFLVEKDWKNYEIIVHAIKSTSKMIGANDVSADALALEKAAEKEDEAFINSNHSRFIDDYTALCEGIGSALGLKDENADSPDEVMEFGPGGDDEVMEFGPGSDDEVMEFGPSGDDEAMEFEPESEE